MAPSLTSYDAHESSSSVSIVAYSGEESDAMPHMAAMAGVVRWESVVVGGGVQQFSRMPKQR